MDIRKISKIIAICVLFIYVIIRIGCGSHSSEEKLILKKYLKKYDALSYMSSKEMETYVEPFRRPFLRFETAKEIKNPGLKAMLLTDNPGIFALRLAPILFFINKPEIVNEIGVIDSLDITKFTFDGPYYKYQNGQSEQSEPFAVTGERLNLIIYFSKLSDSIEVEWESSFPDLISNAEVSVNDIYFDELKLLRVVFKKLSKSLLRELEVNDKNKFVRQTASRVLRN